MHWIAGREAFFLTAHPVLSVFPKQTCCSPSELSVCTFFVLLLSASHRHVWKPLAIYCVYGPVHWACMVTVAMSQISWLPKHRLPHHTAALRDIPDIDVPVVSKLRGFFTNAFIFMWVWSILETIFLYLSCVCVWNFKCVCLQLSCQEQLPVCCVSVESDGYNCLIFKGSNKVCENWTIRHSELMKNDGYIVHWLLVKRCLLVQYISDWVQPSRHFLYCATASWTVYLNFELGILMHDAFPISLQSFVNHAT